LLVGYCSTRREVINGAKIERESTW